MKSLKNRIDNGIKSDLVIRLDFKNRNDLYSAIIKEAQRELRTPENQIIYWLLTIAKKYKVEGNTE